MPRQDATSRIEQIHARNRPLVIAVTGGGSGAISELLRVGGASRTVLEAGVYYAAESLTHWLGSRPEHFCSSRTARAMGMVAYQSARRLTAARQPPPAVAGIACAASLASDRPKRGDHRAHVAWQTRETTWSADVVLRKGHRTRAEEEDLVARLLLMAVDKATTSDLGRPPVECPGEGAALPRHELELLDDETLTVVRQDAPASWQALLAGERRVVGTQNDLPAAATQRAIFPGAFNPRHSGHQQMSAIAQCRLRWPVEFELSIANVDKPPLDYVEMAARAAQFGPGEPLWFTQAPTFVEKSAIFPGGTFVVGADTIVRIAEPRYYAGRSPAEQFVGRDQAIDQIAARGCRFLVFGRRKDDRFQSLETIEIPDALRNLCEGVPESEFRADISSTELRRNASSSAQHF